MKCTILTDSLLLCYHSANPLKPPQAGFSLVKSTECTSHLILGHLYEKFISCVLFFPTCDPIAGEPHASQHTILNFSGKKLDVRADYSIRSQLVFLIIQSIHFCAMTSRKTHVDFETSSKFSGWRQIINEMSVPKKLLL